MIARRCKYGHITGHQSVHLNNGEVARVAIMLDEERSRFGRTVRLKGGNVQVKYDEEKWVECGPYEIA